MIIYIKKIIILGKKKFLIMVYIFVDNKNLKILLKWSNFNEFQIFLEIWMAFFCKEIFFKVWLMGL